MNGEARPKPGPEIAATTTRHDTRSVAQGSDRTGLRRETFATSRAADFFDRRSLQAQTGQPSHRFGDVVVKELLDNALDAAETAGVPPEVSLDVVEADGLASITVTDNGPGIPAELVEGVLDFSVLVSDKAAYRSPTRGLQGNALKTVVGIPHALRCTQPVVIEARGVRHGISASIDPAGELVIDHRQTGSDRQAGTAVTVTVPTADYPTGDYPSSVPDARRWGRRFALVNPHAAVSYLAQGPEPDGPVSYKPTAPDAWRKPLPTDPTSAHWYDGPALARLVFAHIGKTRKGGRDVPLGEFVRSFTGLSSTAKAKAVCALLPTITHLSGFEADPDAVETLLYVMQAASRAPKPAAVGKVDDEHYRERFADWYGVKRFWCKRLTTMDGSVPWVLEVAVAETEYPGELFYAVNYSPTFDDPLARLPMAAGELRATGAASLLRQADAYPDGDNLRAAAVHLISPAAQFLDKGKSTLAVR